MNNAIIYLGREKVGRVQIENYQLVIEALQRYVGIEWKPGGAPRDRLLKLVSEDFTAQILNSGVELKVIIQNGYKIDILDNHQGTLRRVDKLDGWVGEDLRKRMVDDALRLSKGRIGIIFKEGGRN